MAENSLQENVIQAVETQFLKIEDPESTIIVVKIGTQDYPCSSDQLMEASEAIKTRIPGVKFIVCDHDFDFTTINRQQLIDLVGPLGDEVKPDSEPTVMRPCDIFNVTEYRIG